jgi:hypothetical protein
MNLGFPSTYYIFKRPDLQENIQNEKEGLVVLDIDESTLF